MIELDVTGAEPVPEPRRRRPRWVWGGGAVVLAAAIAVAVIGIGAGRAPHEIPAPPPPTAGPLAWVEKLVDAPARGDLAGDEAFTKGLLDRITPLAHGRPLYNQLVAVDGHMHPDQEVRLLFAADIEDWRVVLLALRLPAVIDETAGRTMVTWLVGPRGASPSQLVNGIISDDLGGSGSAIAAPFLVVQVGWDLTAPAAWIGLAPPGCTVSTATDPGATDFRDESTGSYIVRTQTSFRPEYWRVTCDGTVREERPALSPSVALTDDELAALPAGEDIRNGFATIKYNYGGALVGPPSVGWSGSLAGRSSLSDAQAALRLTVVVAPLLRGWAVMLGATTPDGTGAGSYLFVTATDPVPLFAINTPISTAVAQASSDVVLAFPPPAAASVRLVTGDGAVLAEAAVIDGLGILPSPDGPATSAVHVEAVDAAGTTVATARLAATGVSDTASDWSGSPAITG